MAEKRVFQLGAGGVVVASSFGIEVQFQDGSTVLLDRTYDDLDAAELDAADIDQWEGCTFGEVVPVSMMPFPRGARRIIAQAYVVTTDGTVV